MVYAFTHFVWNKKYKTIFFVVILSFFGIFENFVIKFSHEKAVNQMN